MITKQIILIACLTALLGMQSALAYTFNSREYVQIEGQWYEVYLDENFKVVGTEMLVKFFTGTSESQIEALNAALLGETIKVNCKGTYLIQSTLEPPPDPLAFCEDYLEASICSSAVNNTEGIWHRVPNDPFFGIQRFLNTPQGDIFDNDINATLAWDYDTGERDVKIGILDSGLLYWHPDIWRNVWQNNGEDTDMDGTLEWNGERWVYDEDDINGEDDDNNGAVDDLIGFNVSGFGASHRVDNVRQGIRECFHGVPVSGIVGSNSNNNFDFAGVAGGWDDDEEGCFIVFCKMGAAFNQAIAIDGIDYLINSAEVDVITMSFGMAPNDDFSTLLEEAADSSIFLCASSGNNWRNAVGYPARHASVVAVGASSDNGRTGYSNWGDELLITAPSGITVADGQGAQPIVYSAGTVLENGWEVPADPNDDIVPCEFGGTSASSPQVAASAGMLLSQEPDLTQDESFEILFTTTSKDDADEIGYEEGHPYGTWNEEMGYGELNLGNAMQFGRRLEMDLDNGWSMISSNLEPFHTEGNGLDDEDGIFLMFDELVGEIFLLKDYMGRFWYPQEEFCNIPSWDYHQGYYINLTNGAEWITLGRKVDFDEEIPLEAGWAMVAYFPDYELSAPDGFISLWDPEDEEVRFLVIAKNHWGEFYVPSEEFNNMRDLEEGNGYQVYLSDDATLIYPEEMLDGFGSPNEPLVQSNPVHFRFTRTYEFHPVVIRSVAVGNLRPAEGDEIGVFDAEGLCIGASVMNLNGRTGLAVWADDTTTIAVDGYRERDVFYFAYWDSDQNREYRGDSLNIFTDLDALSDNPDYSIHDLFMGESFLLPSSPIIGNNYPNPFNQETIISYTIPNSGAVVVQIYNILGRLVHESSSTRQTAGEHRIVWDGLDLSAGVAPSGIYFYKIGFRDDAGEILSFKGKMLLLR